ncbi:AI-2E family transporter [Amycolatopsis thailandensis]|uniref:AI-2E family transporter n=1 Tax=Amycolatopsis thailandensis TaxID=589330 RepID=UPI0036484D9C
MVRPSLDELPAYRFRRPRWVHRRRKTGRRKRSGRSLRGLASSGLASRPTTGAPPLAPPPQDLRATGAPLPRALVVLLGSAATVIVLAGLYAVAWLVGPVFLALVIVITLDPVRTWLRGKGLPRWLTVAVLVVTVYAALLLLFLVVVVSLAQLSALLPRYAGQADELLRNGMDFLGRFGVGHQQLREMLSSVDTGKLVAFAGSLLAGVGGLATNLAFLLALMLFLSTESAWAGQRLGRIARDRPWISASLQRFAFGTRRYLVVTTVFGGVVAALDTVALALLGIPAAVLWGLLSFVTNYVPNVGFVIGVIPPALIALLDGGWRVMLVTIVVYVLLNFVVQSLIQPKFVAESVGLSTLATVLALVFWTWLLGPLGAVLAVPATLLAKALLIDVDPRARWAEALLCTPDRRSG